MAENDFNGDGVNPRDPLIHSPGYALMRQFAKLASGASADVVLEASINMVVNALRQTYPRRAAAFERLDNRVEVMKDILSQCYDPTSGARLSIFPFNQVIRPQLIKDDDKLRGDISKSKTAN